MDYLQVRVRNFHKTFNIPYHDKPTIPSNDVIARRMNLMIEELQELEAAMSAGDLIEIADGIADLLYVVYGTAVECGIDIYDVNREVHRSNMTKIGGHKREDGKWIKPSTYDPPNIKPIIERQMEKIK